MRQTNTQKRMGRKLISLILITILALTCVGCSKKTPEESYNAAFKKTFEGSSSLNDLLGLEELTEKTRANNAFSYGFDFNIQNISGSEMEDTEMLSGFGISLDAATDMMNRRSHASLGLNYGGATQISLVENLQDTKLSLGVPQLFNGSLFVDLATLSEDLKADTLINELLGFTNADMPDMSTFMETFEKALAENVAVNPLADLDLFEGIGEDLVVKSVKKKEINLPEGVSGKSFYTVTLPSTTLANCLEELMDYSMSMQPEDAMEYVSPEEMTMALEAVTALLGDLSLNVAVNKDGYITYMGNTFSMYGMDLFNLDMTFSGTKSPFDAFTFEFSTATTPKTSIMYEQTFNKSSNEFEIDGKMVAEGTTAMTFGAAGAFTDVEKGKKFTVDFDYIELEVPGEMSLSFGASFYADTTKCEIPTLTGPSYNFFYLTEEELGTLGEEIITSIYTHPLVSELLPELEIPEMPEF